MKEKSNIPPGALPPYVHFKGKTAIIITEDNVMLSPEQLYLMLVEISIKGSLKKELHKTGILPLKPNDTTFHSKIAKLLSHVHEHGGNLKAEFQKAGLLPYKQKLG